MKKILIILLMFPIFLKAENYNFNNAKSEANNYINQSQFSKRNKYLILDNPKFILNESGKVELDNSYKTGGLLNKTEYCISTGNNNCNGSSYLVTPAAYWTLTSGTNGKY